MEEVDDPVDHLHLIIMIFQIKQASFGLPHAVGLGLAPHAPETAHKFVLVGLRKSTVEVACIVALVVLFFCCSFSAIFGRHLVGGSSLNGLTVTM